MFKKVLQLIFSIKNKNNHKVVRLFGLKIKFKRKSKNYIDNSHKIIYFFGLKFKIKLKNRIEIKGKNNKIFLIDNNGHLEKLSKKSISGLDIKIIGDNNTLILPKDVIWLESLFEVFDSSSCIKFSNTSSIVKLYIHIKHGQNQSIIIGKNFSSGGAKLYSIEHDSKITIGDDCMFSTDICLLGSDGHIIKDRVSDNVINYSNGISVGNHVWVGKYAKIMKNTSIANNIVVGCDSLVIGKYSQENSIIAGNPARVVKENIFWERTALSSIKSSTILNDDQSILLANKEF